MRSVNIKIKKAAVTLVALVLFLWPFSQIINVSALTSSSSLNQQKDTLNQQLQASKAKAAAAEQQKVYIQTQTQKINAQISDTQKAINQTQSTINSTQAKIDDLKTQITTQESKITKEKANLSGLISEWYMKGGDQGLAMQIISATSLSGVITMNQYYSSVKDQIATSIASIKALKAQLESDKAAQDKQLADLYSLQSDQSNQKKSLQNSQWVQYRLLNDTTNMISELQTEQSSLQKKIASVQAQIDALSATAAWGTQIVSSNDGSWYYTQSGNYTNLGGSPYTVAQYGCLITSIAMVATYYGQHVTPSDIANNDGNFDNEGYLQVSTPYPVSNIVVGGSQSVNWSVVNSEIDQGRPVIVSIYLPSVGAINSDGSSHFIVIKGHDGEKYFMHDPVAGQRGYNLNQVRSMKLVRAL